MKQIEAPRVLFDKGKAVAVQWDIATAREILERLEDYEDARELEEMLKRPLEFHSLEEVLDEFGIRV